MSNSTRAMFALGISLIIWTPIAFGVLAGRIELPVGGLYYVFALLVSWFGMGFIMNLTNSYRSTAERVERAKREIEAIERRREYESTHRRETDAPYEGKSN